MELKRTISESLKLPKEVTLNLPFITLLGKEQLTIENHKGILIYTTDNINVSTKIGTLVVEGKSLNLKQLTTDALVIIGEVSSIKINM